MGQIEAVLALLLLALILELLGPGECGEADVRWK